MFAPEHCPAKSEIHCFSMLAWKVEPWPVRLPVAHDEPLGVVVAATLLSLPQPASPRAATAARPVVRSNSADFTGCYLHRVGRLAGREPSTRPKVGRQSDRSAPPR